MGFNFGAFLGGAARGASQVLDERRAEAERTRATKEERQWQIATEERAAARSRKATRAAKQKENDEAYEKLVFHFGEKNAAAMMPKGKGYIGEAIKQGQAYNAAGYDGKTMVSIGETEEFTKLPKATGATPTALSQEASTITFKPLPQKAAKEKVSWEARLVSLVDEENALGVIGDDPAQQAKLADIERRRKNTLKQHAQWKSDNAADGVASTAMDWSKQSRNAFIDGVSKRIGRKFDLVETSLDTGIERLLNPAEGVERLEFFTAVDKELKAGYLDAVLEKDRDKSMANLVNNHIKTTQNERQLYVDKIESQNPPLELDNEGYEIPGKYTEIVPPLNFEYADAYEKFVRGEYEYGDIVYFFQNGKLRTGIAGNQGIF